jgi:hypothetical protein
MGMGRRFRARAQPRRQLHDLRRLQAAGKEQAPALGSACASLERYVAGVKMIELVARSAAGDNEQLPATWGDAALL